MALDREKFKALYEYHKTQYDNEVTRGQKLEDKSAKYLTVLTIAITAFTLFVSKWIESLTLPIFGGQIICGVFNIFVLFSLIFTFICFCSSWSLVFRSLSMLKVKKIPSNQQTINTFSKNSLESVYVALSKKYVEAYNVIFINNEKKSSLMVKAYTDIAWSGWSFVLSVLLIFTSNMVK